MQEQVASFSNPSSTITNSDLKMARALAEHIVLERLASLKEARAATQHGSAPAVSWVSKLSSSKPTVVARPIQALAM